MKAWAKKLPNWQVKNGPALNKMEIIRLAKQNSPTILFLHGGPGMDSSYFLPYLKPLSQWYGLAFYTQGSKGHQPEDLLTELDQVYQELETAGQPIVIFAHSFGSQLCLKYLSNKIPDSLTNLILCGWVYDSTWITEYYKRFPEELKNEEKMETSQDFKTIMIRQLDKYFTKDFLHEGKKIIDRIQYNPSLFETIMSSSLVQFDSKPTLTSLNIPIISIAGECDQIISLNYIQTGERLNANIHPVIIKQASHFPFVENQNQVIKEIRTFIENY